jgi:hypothetical protein
MRRQALLLNIYSFTARFAHRRALSCSASNLNAQCPSNLLDVAQQNIVFAPSHGADADAVHARHEGQPLLE